ncbi:hypothetical protein COCCU_09740 [Corynebacterium occultum]|uniref:Uncharacterized protein n=1 Tax=Corynebacterium occultum TaxID=2675219 RepID=A0A6B8VQM4_9CORY|nr:hypothetical protein [Corynebacterium occultum]QGU07872.1 hypothetical protein COCCU_09740 [Corynebacterium occultum]
MAQEHQMGAEYFLEFDPERFAAQIKAEAAARKAEEEASAEDRPAEGRDQGGTETGNGE